MALVDERDGLAAKVGRGLKRLRAGPFVSTGTVLGEACFLLSQGYQRQRLRALLDRLSVAIVECSRKPDWRVWTYDREFRTTWRRVNGSRIPVVGAVSAHR